MINRRGYEVVSEEEYYNDIMKELKTKFPTMSDSPANLLCIFARIIARNENMRDYDRVESFSNAYVATATGQALSKAVRTAGIARISGTRSIGKVILTKDDAISQAIIPRNMRILSGSLEYETTNSSAIIMNGKTIELEIVSIDVGSKFNIANGSKFKSVLNIRGLNEIVASSDVFGGSDVEADLALRQRYFERMNAYANSSIRGIVDAVKAVRDVYLVAGDENVENVEVNGLKPNSFIIFAAGGTNQDIAEAIMTSKPAGVQTNGTIEQTVVVSGKEHKVKFSRFTNQSVFYRVEVAIDRSIAPPSFTEILQDTIVEYTQNNSKIVAYEIMNYISQSIESVRGVRNITFGTSPNPTSSNDLTAESGFNFITARENIEVVVI